MHAYLISLIEVIPASTSLFHFACVYQTTHPGLITSKVKKEKFFSRGQLLQAGANH